MAKFVEFRVRSSKKGDAALVYIEPRVIVSFGECGESVFVDVVGGSCYEVLESLDMVKAKLIGE